MNKFSTNKFAFIRTAPIALLIGITLLFVSDYDAKASTIQQAPENQKQVTGRVTWADGTPAEGIRVAAFGQHNRWHPAYSDPNGYYTLTLPSGIWEIEIDPIVQYDLEQGNFSLQSMAAVLILHNQWQSADTPHVLHVSTDNSSESFTFDIELHRVNSKITGTLRSKDGTLLTRMEPDSVNVRAYSEEYNAYSSFAQIDRATGVYTITVAGGSWELSYSLRDPNSPWLIEPGISETVSATINANSVIQQDLIIEEYNATISGTILRTDTGEPVLGGSVNFSNGYDYRYASVGEDGRFQVAVRSGTTWQVEANWGQNSEAVIYPVRWEGVVSVADAGEMALTIGGIVEQNEAAYLPIVFQP